MQIHSVGIDLGKTTFHLVALGAAGKVIVRRKFNRKQLLVYTANVPASLIGLEACSGAHFLGRALRKQGHDVRLISAQFVKPFVKSNKNDFIDAEAIAEAVERKNMRFVPIKTDDQLDLQGIHRVRDRLICRRTAVMNQLRAFLLERGMVFANRPANLKAAMADILENAEADLTPQMRSLINMLWDGGSSLKSKSQNSTWNWNGSRPRMPDARGYVRSRGSDQSSPLPSLLPLATAPHSTGAGTSLRGWVSCHASTRLEVKRSCSASASAATSACARF
jgi:hypothetical protein